ncbi:hypothetical protein [Falsiroseomonas tokyonensis]|uniref:hypothetical protein n=1 Tax=Falsiroseomonas tokyonensis TaxID=430521 RepID=UPI001C203A80|nr:hypothetical protein [Falsiroseomonas tokyonensis]
MAAEQAGSPPFGVGASLGALLIAVSLIKAPQFSISVGAKRAAIAIAGPRSATIVRITVIRLMIATRMVL